MANNRDSHHAGEDEEDHLRHPCKLLSKGVGLVVADVGEVPIRHHRAPDAADQRRQYTRGGRPRLAGRTCRR